MPLIWKRASFLIVVILLLCSCSYKEPGKSDTNSIFQTESNLILQKTSSHFRFYSAKQDSADISDLESALENKYEKILNDLNTQLFWKVDVYVYPNVKDFDDAINYPKAPLWIAGISDGHSIQMVSPHHHPEHDYQGMIKCAVHEFTHVATASINHDLDSIPRWLRDGLAYLEADQITSSDKNDVTLLVKRHNIPTLTELSDDTKFADIDGYQLAPTAVQFIIDKYGWNKLNEYIKSPDQMETIFNVTLQDFQSQWYDYLNTKYFNN